MKYIFWISILVVLYTYIGYPAIVYLISRLYKQPVKGKYVYPTVSIIMSVYNEEKNIENKIQSLLQLDYPDERFEILIGSDGSKDGTEEILKSHVTNSVGRVPRTRRTDCSGNSPYNITYYGEGRNDTEKLDSRLRGNESKIKVYFREQRQGKPSMLNLLVKEAKGEIVVFTDARQRLAENSLKELVKNFSDRKVGSVSGELHFEDEILRGVYTERSECAQNDTYKIASGSALAMTQESGDRPDCMDSRLRGNDKGEEILRLDKDGAQNDEKGSQSKTGSGMGLYWEYEKIIRESESKLGSMLGATGALYAIRRELFPELPKNLILDDMYIPMRIVQNGYRAIFDPKAEIYDRFSKNAKEEFLRKTRTLAGNFQLFAYMSWLLNPFKSLIAWQFISHKFLRLVVPFLLIGVFISNLYILHNYFYWLILLLQIIFYSLALLGWITKRSNKLFDIPQMFCVMNAAAVVGLYKFLTNRQSAVWERVEESQSHQVT